ncbi:MAG: DMP19 family protein [Pseudomonas sp.]
MGYWTLVEPIWDTVSIYDGADVFLQQYTASPEASRVLFAAHWCQSEINNGGFEQFFSNSTGVLAPEGVQAFRALGLPRTAELIDKAMAVFGPKYPRERTEREDALDKVWDDVDEDTDPFGNLDDSFFELVETENGGFESAADRYAAAVKP